MAVAALAMTYSYRQHLMWKLYYEPQIDADSERDIPVTSMPVVTCPEEWVEATTGHISFRLPPAMFDQVAVKRSDSVTIFESQPLMIGVMESQTIDVDNTPVLSIAKNLYPHESPLSWIDFRKELYEVQLRDFSWSMSADDVAWHSFCASLRLGHAGDFVEVYRSHQGEGLLVVEGCRATFQWHAIGSTRYITLLYNTNSSNGLNMDMVRAICHSIDSNEEK
ncbi:hypothetical protein AB1L30_23200 [Bremerella sp. JC817]|uniref:hypothetical protein n=1 Tax=Bremerella sp. JC817 TaxID=3231756 RepID=UPI003458BB38